MEFRQSQIEGLDSIVRIELFDALIAVISGIMTAILVYEVCLAFNIGGWSI